MYSLVAEHNDFLVVSKHRGVCVHSEPDNPGLIVRLKEDFACDTLFPVHRLDKVTSGLIVCAKTSAATSELSQLFQQRLVQKYYLALSDQKPKKKQGLISGDMERGRRSAWKLCHTKKNPAITQFFSGGLGSGKRLFVLKPATGKTHQLRVALKSIAAPIIGDRMYGHPETVPLGIYLHAYVLGFKYQGVEYQYIDKPESWCLEGQGGIFDVLDKPWELPWPVLQNTKLA